MPGKKPVKVFFVRHGKTKSTKARPLTAEGRQASKKSGKKAPKGYKLKKYHSGALRAKQTAKLFAEGAKAKEVKSYRAVRERKSLALPPIMKDPEKYNAQYNELGGCEFTRRWINNDQEILKTTHRASKVADWFIWESRLGKHLDKKGAEGILLGKFTHGGFPEIILYRLTGLKFDKDTVPRNTFCCNNEFLELTFNKGKVILKFRNIKQDVTKHYNQIISRLRKKLK